MTRNTYTGNGVTTDFTFSFPYLSQSHVLATINGVATTAFTFFSSSTLRFTTAPADGAAVVIYRSTPNSALLADFTAGSAIREQDLELDLQQNLYTSQELKTFVEQQSTAGLQEQITAATNTANTALTVANTQVTFTQSGTGAVSRSVTSKLKDTVSVKDFGAVGDGFTDDTTAVANAIASDTGVIYFPEGTYRVLSGFNSSSPIKIQGEGPGTIIRYEGIGTLFTFSYSQGNESNYSGLAAPFAVDSITLLKVHSNQGDIADCCIELKYTGLAGVIGAHDKLIISDTFIGVDIAYTNPLIGAYWKKALFLNNSAGVYVSNTTIANTVGSAELAAGTRGVHILNSLTAQHNIIRAFQATNFWISRFENGVRAECTVSGIGSTIESVYLSNGEIQSNYAFVGNGVSAGALVNVHMDCMTQAFTLTNTSAFRVTGCDIRSQTGRAASGASSSSMILMSGCSFHTWTGNIIIADNQGLGVFKVGGTWINISGNYLGSSNNGTSKALIVDAGSTNVTARGNQVYGVTGTPPVTDNSGGVASIVWEPTWRHYASGRITGNNEKFILTPNGFLKASSTTFYGDVTSFDEHQFLSDKSTGTRFYSTSASFTGDAVVICADKASNANYRFLTAYSSHASAADAEFILRGDGNGFCDGAWTGGGADYAEYFEWLDGNPENEDRRGISVVLVGDKIKEATDGETPIGVISGNPSVVGDSAWNKWNGKYLRDDYGSYIFEDYEVETEDGETVIQQRRVLNPSFSPDVDYIPREGRPEWDCVGLLGKLRVAKNQAVNPNWIFMREVSPCVYEYLVR
jgi:hypothetical protein